MTEISINAISTIRSVESSGVLARTSVPVQQDSPTPLPDKAQVQNKTLKQTESAPVALVNNDSNVGLKFRVNAKTKDVTVFVVDRNSKRILRSIPADELAKMQAGDLLKLTA